MSQISDRRLDELASKLCVELHLDAPTLREAVNCGLNRVIDRGFNPLTDAPRDFIGILANGIEDRLGYTGYSIWGMLQRDWATGWRDRIVAPAFDKARRYTLEAGNLGE